MPHPAQPLPSTPQQNGASPTFAQIKKARMLVSMLGADFAKTSAHPFFKDLARTAVRPLGQNSTPPDMSRALANLVRRLAEPQQTAATGMTRKAAERSALPQVDPPQEKAADILAQHPALIAKHLIDLPTASQLEALRRLRGQTARQVAAYVAELKK
ncbi:hypothetical protein BCF46_2961 [Litoreibacter meonggei]|uniref:Uncharacterized protein n=1 Tax=Litoreibacter meonggei TaxID=1049199 RepID=A0A497VWF0_9RHOB|nr:hypothetical protein [Litoreibacter meonggei]RLJ41173.1 hypothetical protein BCF46_2961 [Litoreibacter meonggei]